MEIIGIDSDKCVSCGECEKDCPAELFFLEDGDYFFSDDYSMCIGCGHCIAVCPGEAIQFESDEQAHPFPEKKAGKDRLTGDEIFGFLASTRSIRHFKKEAPGKGELGAVLRAMQYAPSASNSRGWEYIVIQDKNKIHYFTEEIIKEFKKVLFLLGIGRLFASILPPTLKKMFISGGLKEKILATIEDVKKGKDPFFFDAPCVIVLHSPAYGHLAECNAGIALTYGTLAARAHSLGTCWIGFAIEAVRRNRTLCKWLDLPPKHKVHGVMALGYPDIDYMRIPPREKVPVRFI